MTGLKKTPEDGEYYLVVAFTLPPKVRELT
jgi:hypothetical protein